MSLLAWVGFAAAALLVAAGVVYLYRRWEAPGRGRMLLAALRSLALAVLILLLFDPDLPIRALGGAGGTRVLLDASLSMGRPDEGGGSAWRAASEAAARLARDGRVLLFGASTRGLTTDSLRALTPSDPSSRLLPALEAASEAGAGRVVVLTDGGIEDAAEVARALPELGLAVDVQPIGGRPAPNRALVEVEAPGWAEAGKPLDVRVGFSARGGGGDSVSAVLREGGRVRASVRLPPPGEGRVAVGKLTFAPEAPAGGGLVRYDIALEPGDAVGDDDVRSIYVLVSDRPAGVALISFRGDWEPRFLLPALEQSLGVPASGFLAATGGRYVRMGTGLEAGRTVAEAEVRRAAAGADLVVLHGYSDAAPAFARALARGARRVLVFPSGEGGDPGLPVDLPPAAAGEWYPTAELPPSPIAPLLAGARLEELPPLTDLRPLDPPAGAWAPLVGALGRRGPEAPLLVAGEAAGRRWVVALAAGFWQWSLRGGEARQAYRRLWAALGGWLVQETGQLAGGAIRPVDRSAPRGEPLRWVASTPGLDSVALRIRGAGGRGVMDTTVTALRADTALTRALPPGHYQFAARAFFGGKEVAAAGGPFTVESYSPEFDRPAAALEGLKRGGTDTRVVAGTGRPLRVSPWPYVLVLLLLSAEWVLRRRWGLR